MGEAIVAGDVDFAPSELAQPDDAHNHRQGPHIPELDAVDQEGTDGTHRGHHE